VLELGEEVQKGARHVQDTLITMLSHEVMRNVIGWRAKEEAMS
jgi:hypothetical protein